MPSSLTESHGNRTIVSEKEFTQESARRLAGNIERFWTKKGWRASDVGVRVVRDDHTEAYFVRSNLRNGTPPGKPQPEA